MFSMRWFGEVAERRVDEAGHAGAQIAGQRVLSAANQLVPLLSGTLRDTGTVDVEGSEATVSYNTKYAAILHEHPEWNFRNGRDGHWLQDAAERSGAEVADDYGKQIRMRL